MNKNPLITVIITTYNSNINYFSECLQSIINQTYKNLEILIIDDFSKKMNYKKIKLLIKKNFKDKRIKIYQNKKNFGVSKSLNNGIKFSKGEYLTWCSYDDYFHLDKISLQYNKIKNLDKTIISCNTTIKYENYNFFRKVNYNFITKDRDSLLLSDKFSGGSFLISKKIFNMCGFFNEKLRFTQDYDMWLRFYDYNIKFINLNKYLFFSRIHILQDTNKNSNKVIKEKNKFYLEYLKKNILYFINFYSRYDLIKISFFFRIRGYFDISNYIDTKILKFYNSKKLKIKLYFLKLTLSLTKFTSNSFYYSYSFFKKLIIKILNFVYYIDKIFKFDRKN